MINRLSVLLRLHPIEIVTPLVLALALSLLCVPNYLEFAPNMEMKQAVGDLQDALERARILSADGRTSEVVFFSQKGAKKCVFRYPGENGYSLREVVLPERVEFGRGNIVPPLPGPTLHDGSQVFESDTGVTFKDNRLTFQNGSVKGFPGAIYLHNRNGENLAVEVPIFGDVRVWEWSGDNWVKGTRWLPEGGGKRP